jgi:hypothetical protein
MLVGCNLNNFSIFNTFVGGDATPRKSFDDILFGTWNESL